MNVERLARAIHSAYQDEARRQGDVRYSDDYDSLPENIKEYDRAIARLIIEREKGEEE